MRPPPTKPTGPATRPPATAPTAVCVARPAALAADVAATTAATAAMTANPPSVLIEIILATLAIRQADQDTWPEFGTRRRLSRDRAPWSNDVTATTPSHCHPRLVPRTQPSAISGVKAWPRLQLTAI